MSGIEQEIYELEKKLSCRIRNAPSHERGKLYSEVYNDFYNIISKNPNNTVALNEDSSRDTLEKHLSMLDGFLNKDSVFMEIGPGKMDVCLSVAKRVKKVLALDVTGENIKDIKLPDNVDFRVFSGTDLPGDIRDVDVIFSSHQIEHLHPEDLKRQLRDINSMLKPGGVYVCITPNRLTGPYDGSRFFDEESTGFHIKEYTEWELRGLLKTAGFRRVYRSFHNKWARGLLIPVLNMSLLEKLFVRLSSKLRFRLGEFFGIRIMLSATCVKIVAYK